MKETFQKIRMPLLALAAIGLLYALWNIFDLPPQSELVEIARGYFERYGLLTVFICACAEALLLIGWYFPGSIVIFLGVIFAGRDIEQVAAVVLVAAAGIMIGYTLDYVIGRYGWYRLFLKFGLKEGIVSAEQRLERYGWKAFIGTYWHPNLASMTATGAGILHFPFVRFVALSIISVCLWNTFWSGIIFIWGEATLSVIGIRFGLLAITFWILYRLVFSKKVSIP